MERAGAAAAAVAAQMLPVGGTALIVAGPGNNGGDAFVVARLLKQDRRRPLVVFAGSADKLPPDARLAYERWLAAGGEVLTDIPARHFGLVVDGLFGIGLTRPVSGSHADLVARINELDSPVLALDVPSGLDSETGRVLGCAVRATRTATFIALKPGLLTLDGPDHCGEVSLHTLEIDCREADGVRLDRALLRDQLRPRARNTHKGSFGSVGIIGGAAGMAGAALLAGRAALQLGAGRVYVGMLERLPCDPCQPELMLRAAEEVFALATVLAVGPGLGQSPAAAELLRRSIAAPLPLVVDADGLNLLAAHPVFANHAARRGADTILTPHPAEAARLLGTTVAEVQADRVAAALKLANRFRAGVVLKGCGSVVATADGRWAINASGNAGLASAGSGDVLTGIVAALLAQGWPAAMALAGGVHLHGAAADHLVADACGPIGITAAELIPAARKLLNRWTLERSQHC
jgi:hydroxyethylthiazole kinase-like uncharacterized protein yjeF